MTDLETNTPELYDTEENEITVDPAEEIACDALSILFNICMEHNSSVIETTLSTDTFSTDVKFSIEGIRMNNTEEELNTPESDQ